MLHHLKINLDYIPIFLLMQNFNTSDSNFISNTNLNLLTVKMTLSFWLISRLIVKAFDCILMKLEKKKEQQDTFMF